MFSIVALPHYSIVTTCSLFLQFGEILFANAAFGANPLVGQMFEGCPGRYAMLGVTG